MILYNITWVTEPTLEAALIDYLGATFVPAVLADGCMHSPALHRIEREAAEGEGVSLALHFLAEEATSAAVYWSGTGSEHIAKLIAKFGNNRVMGFATTMTRIAF
ncbi:DUF4286 family protein [Porphyromonas loveana]|uniref:Uncharacterized protein DUF4286 n=1 Tax=Porphyromonas loveana TaxID=1884669 RepID=A0A2U1FAS5_9PORP|nr:DUF4286 family protein [Porphyromonas loveana]PVZ09282.1 uncharacterized protein DUF4286 [Porphyromonas loveana]